ncbi:MAG: hypothetical protein SVR04_03915 [Spirochaetota bacterium]|nr:hypothetical protein [Spirochaetota bacterium]
MPAEIEVPRDIHNYRDDIYIGEGRQSGTCGLPGRVDGSAAQDGPPRQHSFDESR